MGYQFLISYNSILERRRTKWTKKWVLQGRLVKYNNLVRIIIWVQRPFKKLNSISEPEIIYAFWSQKSIISLRFLLPGDAILCTCFSLLLRLQECAILYFEWQIFPSKNYYNHHFIFDFVSNVYYTQILSHSLFASD